MKTGAGKGVPGALMLVRAGVLVCFVAAFFGFRIKDSNAFLLILSMDQFCRAERNYLVFIIFSFV